MEQEKKLGAGAGVDHPAGTQWSLNRDGGSGAVWGFLARRITSGKTGR